MELCYTNHANDNQYQKVQGGSMSAEVISYMLSQKNAKKRTIFQLVLQCSPFLKGLKASTAITIQKKYYKELIFLLRQMNLSWEILMERKEGYLLFIYRRVSLIERLEKESVEEFLQAYGYEGMSLQEMLEHLSLRARIFFLKKDGFPHEIGVFLDYPLEDVKSFIQKEGKEYLASGYWKVYHNLEEAKGIFRSFDEAREEAVEELLQGKSIFEITKVA